MSKWCDRPLYLPSGDANPNYAIHLNTLGVYELIKKLEKVVNDYSYDTRKEPASIKISNSFVLSLLRCYKYNNLKWEVVAGVISPNLIKYAEDKEPEIMAQIKKGIHITYSDNDKEIELDHLAAVIDGYFNFVTKEWSGWMGDVATFAKDLVKWTSYIADYDEIVQVAIEKLGSNDSSMSFLDIHSDIDGENLYNDYLKNNEYKFSDAFYDYYIKTNKSKLRYDVFITNMDPSYDADLAWQKLIAGPSDNIYVFLNKYDPDNDYLPAENHRTASYGTFANYVFTNRDIM